MQLENKEIMLMVHTIPLMPQIFLIKKWQQAHHLSQVMDALVFPSIKLSSDLHTHTP